MPKPIELLCKKHNYKALGCHLKKKSVRKTCQCVTHAQNTLDVLGVSGNTGKGIFTIQIAAQAQTLSSAQNRANLGVAGNMKVTEGILNGIWVFQVVWYLSVVLFVCISFQLKLIITYIIPEFWSSSQYTYTSSCPLFPSFISLYGRYQQNKDRTGHTALRKQLLSDPASQS